MTTSTTQVNRPKTLHIVLWIAQVVLALMFLMAGFMKITQPIDQLATTMTWTGDVPEGLVRFIGVCEFLGALGLLLPAMLRIKPQLTPWAATGLAAIMLSAMIFHVSRGEFSAIGINVFLGLIAVFIAWGRFRKAPISARS